MVYFQTHERHMTVPHFFFLTLRKILGPPFFFPPRQRIHRTFNWCPFNTSLRSSLDLFFTLTVLLRSPLATEFPIEEAPLSVLFPSFHLRPPAAYALSPIHFPFGPLSNLFALVPLDIPFLLWPLTIPPGVREERQGFPTPPLSPCLFRFLLHFCLARLFFFP